MTVDEGHPRRSLPSWALFESRTACSVSIPFLTGDYNASTGAATKKVSSANTLSVSS
jgi:hypothetical protein